MDTKIIVGVIIGIGICLIVGSFITATHADPFSGIVNIINIKGANGTEITSNTANNTTIIIQVSTPPQPTPQIIYITVTPAPTLTPTPNNGGQSSISGRVYDANHKAVPNAKVTIYNTKFMTSDYIASNPVQTSNNPQFTSDDSTSLVGFYQFSGLTPDVYILTAEKNGIAYTETVQVRDGTTTMDITIKGYTGNGNPMPTPIATPTVAPTPPIVKSAELLSGGADKDTYNPGDTATIYANIENTGTVTISDATLNINVEKYVPNIGYVNVQSSTTTLSNMNIQPGGTGRAEYTVSIPSDYEGVSTAGQYRFTIDVLVWGNNIGEFQKEVTVQ